MEKSIAVLPFTKRNTVLLMTYCGIIIPIFPAQACFSDFIGLFAHYYGLAGAEKTAWYIG
jgi:hypothetical protein